MGSRILRFDSPKYLQTADAARVAGLAQSTLVNMRSRGEGPPFVKSGRIVRYPEDDLLAWVASRTRTVTPRS